MSIDDKDDEFSLPDFEDEEGSEGDSGEGAGDSAGDDFGDGFDDDTFGSSEEDSIGGEAADTFEDSFGEDSAADTPEMDAVDDLSSSSAESESETSAPSDEGITDESAGESAEGGEYEASIFSSGMSDAGSETGEAEASSGDYDESADMYDYGKLEDKEEERGGSKSKVFLILVGVMCVIFVGLGGTYLWLKSKNKEETLVQEGESPALAVVDTLSSDSSDSVDLATSGIGASVGEESPSLDSEPLLSTSSTGSESPAQTSPSSPEPAPIRSQTETAPPPTRTTPPPTRTAPPPTRAAPPSTTPVASAASSSGNLDVLNSTTGRAYVIVASYSNRAAAMRHGRRLADQGHQVQIISPFSRWRYYRISLANYSTYREAAQQLGRYRREFGSDVWVLPYR